MTERSHDSRPLIGGFTAACVLVSNVIGGGIFTATGFMARDLGDPWVILLLWGIGAAFALAGALSYSELAAAMPQTGGEYVYIREAYGPLLGYLSGWASFVVGFGAAIAAASASFAAYVLQLVPRPGHLLGAVPADTAIALLLIWTLTAVHGAGVKAGGWLQRLLTITKAGAILILVVGAFVFGNGSWEHFGETAAPSPTWGRIAVSFIFVVYAYSGWNAVGYIAGEIANPARSIPLSLVAGTLFVGAVYLLLNAVYFYALPTSTLAQPPVLPVAEKAAVALFGAAGARVVTILLAVSIAAAVSAMTWAGPRVYQAMARDGRFPAWLSTQWKRGGAPGPAILLQTAWASFLIVTGTFEQLVVYTGMVLGIFSALGVSAVLVLRVRMPGLPRPFRVPLYPLTPCAYVATAVAMLLYSAAERPTEALFGFATVLAGVPFYFVTRHSSPVARPKKQSSRKTDDA